MVCRSLIAARLPYLVFSLSRSGLHPHFPLNSKNSLFLLFMVPVTHNSFCTQFRVNKSHVCTKARMGNEAAVNSIDPRRIPCTMFGG